MKAIILTIGNEVLNGQVVDTNAAWLAQNLLEIGIPVKLKWSVGDEIEEIVQALEYSALHGEIIIATGGLGPTADDLTSEALAKWMKVDRIFHEDIFERLTKILSNFGKTPNESHRIQCLLPQGVKTIPNKNGTAPGMYFNFDGKHVIAMPGVPFEMKAIFDPHVKDLLQNIQSGPKRKSHTFNTVGEGETFLEDSIRDITIQAPAYIGFAFLPDIYKVRIRVDLDGEYESHMDTFKSVLDQIRERLKGYIVGENETTLELAIGRELKKKAWMMGTAESCTGGYTSHLITNNAGSSEYYKGSIIAYHNQVKHSTLKVQQKTLELYGAVSEETVQEMAKGALHALEVQVAVSISGIAGPTGGSVEKPVGTIWIAVADITGKIVTKKVQLRRDRQLNIRAASNMALITLYRFLVDE